MVIPKEIIEKVKLMNQLEEEINDWAHKNLDGLQRCDIDGVVVVNKPMGDMQSEADGKRWCVQRVWDDYAWQGTYFYETECPGEYLAIDVEDISV